MALINKFQNNQSKHFWRQIVGYKKKVVCLHMHIAMEKYLFEKCLFVDVKP